MNQIKAGTHAKSLKQRIWRERWAYILLVPVVLFFLIFHYFPMYGVQLAFKDFAIRKGISGSSWVGLKHFRAFPEHDFLAVCAQYAVDQPV